MKRMLVGFLMLCLLACNHTKQNISIQPVDNPARRGSIAPNLTAAPGGRVILSWIEPEEKTLALRFAIRGERGWSVPQTIVRRDDFDKYAEAPAWVIMLANGNLVSVWAEELPSKEKWPGNYLHAAVSQDQGKSWSQPLILHSDKSNSEHSFASLVAVDESHANIVWLDARDYNSNHKYRLMSAVISSSGAITSEETLDDDVCTCCPTSLARIPTGLIAAYRDHTGEEIRDIFAVRKVSGRWQAGNAIHHDGWHINACPVNGPALASQDDHVVAAWYTGTEERGTVRVAFSNRSGETFADPITVDKGDNAHTAMGRPSVTILPSGDALVVWTRLLANQAELVATRVNHDGNSGPLLVLGNGATQGLGYARSQLLAGNVLVSWGGSGETKQIKTALLAP